MSNESFKNYISQNLQKIKETRQIDIESRNVFLEKYPLSKIKELSIEEYCLGTEQSKDSLSYLMEFGKIGFGIGGGSAKKHGVYFNKKENCYMHGSDPIASVDEFWKNFRNEFYQFLILSGESKSSLPLDDYPLLQGMAMVLTKYLSLYFPQKYLTIGSINVLRNIMDALGYSYDDSMRCHQINYALTDHLKKEFPELRDEDGAFLGGLAWEYINGEEIKAHKRSNTEAEKGAGLADEDVRTVHYWMYAPGDNANKWEEFYRAGIMAIGWEAIGDLSAFSSKKEMKAKMQEVLDPEKPYINASLATWQFANEMKPGDVVFAKKGMHSLVGRGIVVSDYEYDESVEDKYKNIRQVKWTHCGEWEHPGQAVMKTLTDITSYTDYVEKLEAIFRDTEIEDAEDEPAQTVTPYPPYDEEQFLKDVYMGKTDYDTLVGLVRMKKNIILQGAPGVGKTYTAKRLAYSMMGVKDQDRIMMVQFHQSYSYEDFIEGFRPASGGNGFEIKKGSFYHFCKKAADDQENGYFFIIDEINRGNLSRIFGELFMLIENDKRGNALQLLYSDEKFFVPRNVYIIGMMNTADRSLAMLDYALRRRFAFFDIKPSFEAEGFREYREALDSRKFDRLINCVKELNEYIKDDESLGEGFCIGHSYFCNLEEADDAGLKSIVDYELAPLLREYWYDDRTKANDWINRLKDAIK
ncbi:MAG: AAA family ATPase [Clostridia bacterium]|nr:AAA family ATPase [Clostridia bacterium]